MAKAGTKTRKVTVTVPANLLEAAAARVSEGCAPSLSAYVSKALKKQVEADREDGFLALLREMDEEFGPVSPETLEWARRFIAS